MTLLGCYYASLMMTIIVSLTQDTPENLNGNSFCVHAIFTTKNFITYVQNRVVSNLFLLNSLGHNPSVP